VQQQAKTAICCVICSPSITEAFSICNWHCAKEQSLKRSDLGVMTGIEAFLLLAGLDDWSFSIAPRCCVKQELFATGLGELEETAEEMPLADDHNHCDAPWSIRSLPLPPLSTHGSCLL
jgi:hypothetical protein